MAPKFKIGDRVDAKTDFGRQLRSGQITAIIDQGTDMPGYRIRCGDSGEKFESHEDQLTPWVDPTPMRRCDVEALIYETLAKFGIQPPRIELNEGLLGPDGELPSEAEYYVGQRVYLDTREAVIDQKVSATLGGEPVGAPSYIVRLVTPTYKVYKVAVNDVRRLSPRQ